MQNYLCKRLHCNCRKLPYCCGKSASYRVILDKEYTFLNVLSEQHFGLKFYNYWPKSSCWRAKML